MSVTELLPEDVRWCVRLLGSEVAEAVQENALIVAGGFIRAAIAREEPNDIDVFPCGEFQLSSLIDKICGHLHAGAEHRKSPIRTNNAITFTCNRIPVQVVHRWRFDNPISCIESFDYTIARAAIWWDKGNVNASGSGWKSVCDARFYQDLAAKRLVYAMPTRDEEAGGSMLRLMKFYQRGYRAPLDTITDVAMRWLKGVKLPLDDPEFRRIATALLIAVDPAADPTRDGHL